MALSEVVATLQALERGELETPNWAGGRIYIGNEAKSYWGKSRD